MMSSEEKSSEWWQGHREGFQGEPCRSAWFDHFDQAAYLEGWKEGANDREKVEDLCIEDGMKDDPLALAKLFKKAMDHYFEYRSEQ